MGGLPRRRQTARPGRVLCCATCLTAGSPAAAPRAQAQFSVRSTVLAGRHTELAGLQRALLSTLASDGRHAAALQPLLLSARPDPQLESHVRTQGLSAIPMCPAVRRV